MIVQSVIVPVWGKPSCLISWCEPASVSNHHLQILDLVIPSIKERREEQERWAKAREKTAKQLGSNGGASAGEVFGR